MVEFGRVGTISLSPMAEFYALRHGIQASFETFLYSMLAKDRSMLKSP